MSKSKKSTSVFLFLCSIFLGLFCGFGCFTYINLPLTDTVVSTEECFYSKTEKNLNSKISVEESNISVHFLELGNKYTGDCTYIKTDTCDILIDCGSKSNSISTVSSYLNQYVTDNTLEYVIVTHAHQDHYAGFATTTSVNSIFDLYKCENVITFAKTNQKETSSLYKNFKRELQDEINNDSAKVVTALDCINSTNGATRQYNIGTDVTLTILDSYYYTNNATTENDYSVCCLISYGTHNMLFTGDLESGGEKKLVELNSLPEVDLYKAGHHGSKTSSSNELLEVVKPKTVCICCCAGSPEYTKTTDNQFPTQDFINRVSIYTKNIYVTTLCVDYENDKFESFNGNIIFVCSVAGFDVKCSNNNTILKESDWFKANRTWPTNGK